jgi:hypothetical protein
MPVLKSVVLAVGDRGQEGSWKEPKSMDEMFCETEARHRPGRASILLALAAFLIPSVLAAHVERMSVPELAAVSPHIVVALVESREVRWNARHTLLFTDYTLRIEDRLRGGASDRVSISVPGGTLGNLSDETCVTVHLEPGSRYLLFLGRLDQPGMTPILGAWQGMFREIPGDLAAAGESPEPLVLRGHPVRFSDLVAAVRPLAAKTFEARPVPPPNATLPAKIWDSAARPVSTAGSLPPLAGPQAETPPRLGEGAPGIIEIAGRPPVRSPRPLPEKFVYHELAKLPIVISPLLADSPFSPWDQHEMAYWNVYGGDLFRVTSSPSATWSYGNGVFDIAGFPGDAQMRANFNRAWGDVGAGVLALTFARRVDGVLTEADTVFNPNKAWTLDDAEGTSRGGAYPFKDVVLHELGHFWGLLHAWELGPVDWDSVMNYRGKFYYAVELFADDTTAVRAAFPPGAPRRDGLISSYTTFYDQLQRGPEYAPVRPAVSTVRAGDSFSLTDPIKIENTGTVPLVRPAVEVYLTPARLSFAGAVLAKRIRLGGTVLSGATQKVDLGKIRVPPGTRVGTYYLAFFLRDPKDTYQANNGSWSTEEVTLTVTRR